MLLIMTWCNRFLWPVQNADGVDEFVKSGLTPVASEVVKPYRVKESPVQFECKVTQIIPRN
jgi:flavin reductase (DIM6/NTAB) family NADH-FMN oxidoreductase RutF